MIKKALIIVVLSGLLLLPLSRCKKSDELSDAEVNEIFNKLCLLLNDAMSQANSSTAASAGRLAAKGRVPDIITYSVDWEGSGRFEGIWIKGSITANTDSGFFDGNYAFGIGLYDASTDLKNTVILNSASGILIFNGNAYASILHSDNHWDFDMIIGVTRYRGTADYEVDAVGAAVTYEGTVVLNGKAYSISS